jgi:hypothetical protein
MYPRKEHEGNWWQYDCQENTLHRAPQNVINFLSTILLVDQIKKELLQRS